MKPKEYLNYLKHKKWVPTRRLGSKMIISFMPTGFDADVWGENESENYFMGRVRKLNGDIELLSSFGIGGPAVRTHLGLATEDGVNEVIFVGTAGAQNSNLKIGDILCLEGSKHNFSELAVVSFSTIFDPWDESDKESDVVEMEAQHIFAWCQKEGVKCSGLVVISDLLYDKDWNPGFDQIKDALGRAHRLAYASIGKVDNDLQ